MPGKDSEATTIRRQLAQSGNVSYGETVVIHETSRSRIAMVPFFIRRSAGTELAVKLVAYQKAKPPNDRVFVEEKSISLKGSAARALLEGLNDHLAVAQEDEDGNYILLRVSEGTAELGAHEPAVVASALMRVLSQGEIVEHLADAELSEELVHALRGAIRLKEMQAAVSQLRAFLDSGEVKEAAYQEWCETHTWAFGNAYVMRDDVRNISTGDQLDLLLPTVISGYRDIVELKRPDMDVLRYDESHRNYYFSAEASKAIGQCHRYLDVFADVAARGLLDHPEIVAYHPRAIVVIGRSNGWPTDRLKALHGLNRRLSGVTLMTYDHLLAQGERLIELLGTRPAEQDSEDELSNQSTSDDDVPF